MVRFSPSGFRHLADADPQHGGIRSPASLVAVIAISAFIIDFGLTVLLAGWPAGPWACALLDATLVTALLAPVLYVFVFRPLRIHISALQLAHGELRRQRDQLEEVVRLRTDELTQSNAALEASLREIEDLYQNAPFGYNSIDRDGMVVRMNDTLLSWLGYARDEVIGRKHLRELLAPGSAAGLGAHFARLKECGWLQDLEAEFMRRDGSAFPVLVNVSAVRDKRGQFVMSRASVYDVTERKRYEDSLYQSSQLLERVFNTTYFCAAYLDRDFNFIRVNQAYADACGQDTGYFPGKNHFHLYPHAENEAIFRDVRDTGLVYTVSAKPFEFPEHPEWGVTYWDWTLHPLKNADGKLDALLLVLADVTERWRAELALTEAADKLEIQVEERTAELRAKEMLLQETLSLNQNILSASAIGIAAYRRDGRCILANPAFAKIVGGTGEQLLAQDFNALRSWRESGLLALAQRVLASGANIEQEIQLTTTFGREVWLDCHLSPFMSQGEAHLLLMFHDIREERLTARALQESEQRFRTLAAATFEGVAISRDGTLVDVNEQLARMLGYEAGELIGQPLLGLVAPEDRERVGAIMQLGTESVLEHEILRKDGSRLVLEAHGRTIEQNGVVMQLTAARDITARVKAAAELKAAKAEAERANKAKSRFLAAASHDLRQPLTALKFYVATLERKLGPEDATLLTNMHESVGGLSNLLSKLLDLSKLDAGAVKPQVRSFALDDLLGKVVAAHAPEAESKALRVRWRRAGLTARTDPVLFQRIIGNFAANAMRYTERGGVLIGCRRHAGKLWVEVWDTGIGIPPQRIGEIFEEFKQLGDDAQAHGSGLGLAIVARTADLLGLGIRVQSRSGRGSMFAIELPLGKRIHTAAQPRAPYLARPTRIGVVDDNAIVLNALALGLQDAGYEVVAAADGEDLLARLGARAPDLVVCDYRLAAGKTGFDLISAVRAEFERRTLPAVIITGDTDPRLMRSMTKNGIVILHKPVELEHLQQRIEEAMKRPEGGED